MPSVPEPLPARKPRQPDAVSGAQQFAQRTANAHECAHRAHECAHRAHEYPETDGKPMAESETHAEAMVDVMQPLKARYAHRGDVHVGGNLMMYYVPENKHISVSPDVFVAFGPSREPLRDVWLTWEEGKLADFVLEVASKTTHGEDEARKRLLYQRLGVTEYWQHDPTGRHIDPLKGHRLNDRGVYERLPLATTPEGMPCGESKLLALYLCLDAGRLRLFDPATAKFLATYEEKDRIIADKERMIQELQRRLADR